MRISTDPTDPAYLDDRLRRVWCNDREVIRWVIADEFRRVVITADGNVHNGAVHVERLKDNGMPGDAPSMPANAGFSGTAVHVSDKPKAADPDDPEPEAPRIVVPDEPKRRRR